MNELCKCVGTDATALYLRRNDARFPTLQCVWAQYKRGFKKKKGGPACALVLYSVQGRPCSGLFASASTVGIHFGGWNALVNWANSQGNFSWLAIVVALECRGTSPFDLCDS